MNYIFVLIATVLLAFDFALQKKYQGTEGTGLAAGLKFNALNGLFTALIFFALGGLSVAGLPFFAVYGFFDVAVCHALHPLGL